MTVVTTDDAITYPVTGRGFPEPGTSALMVATQNDLQALCRLFKINADEYYTLYMSRMYVVSSNGKRFSIVGPLLGAPYAAIILETLIAGGVAKIVFWGWCGAVSSKVKIGDIIVPDGSIIDEGTSRHYGADFASVVESSSEMTKKIKEALKRHRLDFHEGTIWTTDAIFRETRAKVEQFQSRGVLAVEMETSALFSVGRFHKVNVGAVLVVSDELSTFSWKPGFRNTRFRKSLVDIAEVISQLSRHIYQSTD